MNYTIDWLKEQRNTEYLFFWGHQPCNDGLINKACLSQWWFSDFIKEGVKYATAEHYMMANKAKLFNDMDVFEKIITKPFPKDVKDLGRQIKNFDASIWNANKYEIVKAGNYLKFSQNESLKQFLIHTKNKVLVEASPVDAIWGIGMSEDDPKAKNPIEWRGENLLGFALMEVRNELNKI